MEEQHYIICYGINGESMSQSYCTSATITYPGKPDLLLSMILNILAKEQSALFNKFVRPENIGIKNLTRVK